MKEFEDFVKKYEEYLADQQNNSMGLAENKWFNEYIEEVLPSDTVELLRTFKQDAKDCGTRSAIKEMLDFISTMSKAKTIRDKKRINFFADSATRINGNLYVLNQKRQSLSNVIKKGN